MKSPYEQAFDAYHTTDQGQTWGEFVTEFFHGPECFVYSSPGCFAMWKLAAGGEAVIVEAAAGDLRELVKLIPARVTHLVYQRGKTETWRLMPVERLRKGRE